MFGQPVPPTFQINQSEMESIAKKIIRSQIAVTGVQPKLSLEIEKDGLNSGGKRLTIVGLWGSYILKPQTKDYEQLPEVEDLSMHLADIAKIDTVPHCLIHLKSGELAYITKRIDRDKKKKIHMEDMCQLTERLTEDKYHGSYEQIAKTILKFSTNPVLDVVNFFEQVLFSFLIGNADMHLKNYSLIYEDNTRPLLSPAYDLVATAVINPADKEDLALTLNGKRSKINKRDFEAAFKTLKLESKQQENIFNKMQKAKSQWSDFIEISFLTNEHKSTLKAIIQERFDRLS